MTATGHGVGGHVCRVDAAEIWPYNLLAVE